MWYIECGKKMVRFRYVRVYALDDWKEKMRRTIEELEQDSRQKLVIDVRKDEDYETDTYSGAIHIYWEEFMDRLGEIPKDLPVYLLCYTGQRSDDLSDDCVAAGYDEVYSIEGGFHSYLRLKLRRLLAEQGEEKTGAKLAKESILGEFRTLLWEPFLKALMEYQMLEDGDRVAVCISGGKDSMMLAKLFQIYEEMVADGAEGYKKIEVVYLVMNPGYNELNAQTISNNAKLLDIPITVFHTEIFDTVASVGDSPCYLCARMRRGYLYSKAGEYGCNKIALGHHFDDVIETIMMGMLYGAQVQTMMPKLHSTNFDGMELIRPLYLVHEEDIIRWRDYNHLYFIQCACRFTESCASCGGTEKGSKRASVKTMIRELRKTNPDVEMNIFKSVENVNLDRLIAYKDGNQEIRKY